MSREAVSKEPGSGQHDREGAGKTEGVFELERVEHETGGAFGPEGATSEELEPEKPFLPEPAADESGEDSSDDESEPDSDQDGQSSAHQEVPAAARNVRLVYRRSSTYHAESPEKRTRRCLTPDSDARGGRQSFTTGADHAPRSTGVPGMANLAACAKKAK